MFLGCNVGLTAPTLGETTGSPDAAAFHLDASTDSQPSVAPSVEAGTADTKPVSAPKFVVGTSPLCSVLAGVLAGYGGCDPDRVACVYNATDAGGDSGSDSCEQGSVCAQEPGGPPVLEAACRVISSKAMCSTAYKAGGKELCTTSADCDIGYECTGVPVPAIDAGPSCTATNTCMGTCKHYCCDGDATCTALGPDWFCDIESVFHGINSVPVCALGKPCVPFGSECAAGETCTLVNETTMATACVTPGLAEAGDDCTRAKCGEGLACIGDTCKQLCKLMADGGPGACPAKQTCVASSLLGAYADVGLCSESALP